MSKELVDPHKLIPDVCHTRWYEEKRSFVILKKAFLEMFVSVDLLGPKETILIFAQFLAEYLVDPD